MTTISDPRLQELWENATDQGFLESRAVFIRAVNERLQAAERLAAACAVEHGQHDFEPECGVCYALAAYHKGTPNE